MSIESAKSYVERLKTDEDFSECILNAENADARKKIVQVEGFNFTKEDIDAVVSMLSDEELSDVTRGPWSGSLCECGREGELGCR
ncbi:MAG: Nif11-like leader peptide family RiPP precursor [Bacillota bacterium]|nr:Nif11-like leader peptide family RiPP precursor [Bacillota bacterium]MDW7684995.1 Nif11-like leader peptide family RiPP precursor [Bacillota bacterium]